MADPFEKVPPGSYAWCSDCPWRDDTSAAGINGKLHCDALQHIVHLWTPDPVDNPVEKS